MEIALVLFIMLPQNMNGVATTDFLAYSERIAKTNMKIYTNTKLEEIKDKGVVVSTPKGAEEFKADTVILALGFKADNELYNKLVESGKEAYVVGDAMGAGKIFDAIHTAYCVRIKL